MKTEREKNVLQHIDENKEMGVSQQFPRNIMLFN